MDSERCHLYPLQEFCVDGRYLLPSAIALSSDLTPSSELLHLLGLIIVHCTFNMHNFCIQLVLFINKNVTCSNFVPFFPNLAYWTLLPSFWF